MNFLCDNHGVSNGVIVSPDLVHTTNSAQNSCMTVVYVEFEYYDDIADECYLSETYANQIGIMNDTKMPLPEFYPEWYLKLVPICEKCLWCQKIKKINGGI